MLLKISLLSKFKIYIRYKMKDLLSTKQMLIVPSTSLWRMGLFSSFHTDHPTPLIQNLTLQMVKTPTLFLMVN
jgi:hypothetical protein